MASVITSNDGSLVLNGGSSSVPKGGYVVSTDSVFVYVKANYARTVWKLDYKSTTLDGVSYSTPQELVEALSVFSRGGTGPSDGVRSIVAGPGISVDDTDPENPVVSSGASAPKWDDIQDKPAVIAEGDTQADARTALGLGSAATQDSGDFATAAQGLLAETSIQVETDPTVPSHVKSISAGDISSWNSKATTTDISNAIDALNLGTASEADASDFATAAQGALADSAVQPSGLPTWSTISGKPAFVAEGANAAAARTALGLGTAATQASGAFATAAQGALADTALQPAAIASMVESKQEGGVGITCNNILAFEHGTLPVTRVATTFYFELEEE